MKGGLYLLGGGGLFILLSWLTFVFDEGDIGANIGGGILFLAGISLAFLGAVISLSMYLIEKRGKKDGS